MGREITKAELETHKLDSLKKLDSYITSLIQNDDPKINSKADKLCYWIKDWTTFLEYEPNFSPRKLRRYKRGEIIKVHLGYNIGSEQGGLHYAVVLDKDNPLSSPVITIVPLTSIKHKMDLNNIKSGNINLGNELFIGLSSKINTTIQHIKLQHKNISKEIAYIESRLASYETSYPPLDNVPINPEERSEQDNKHLLSRTKHLEDIIDGLERYKISLENLDLHEKVLDKMKTEISKMKLGSIALVNQITTISKLRIYDPKTQYDVLHGVKLSNEKLDLIDAEVIKKFTNYKI